MEMQRELSLGDVLEMIGAYYSMKDNDVGGNLHILLDDYNTEDCHVIFCWRRAKEMDDRFGVALAEVFLEMDMPMRDKVLSMYAGRDITLDK